MRKIDFIVQSALLIGCAISLMATWYHWEMLYLFLLGQLFIGIWQYGSTLLSFLFGKVNYRKKYFLGATVYLMLLFILFNLHIPTKAFLVYFFIPPWWLALYYYIMTWRSFFIRYKKSSSGFLPHTNF